MRTLRNLVLLIFLIVLVAIGAGVGLIATIDPASFMREAQRQAADAGIRLAAGAPRLVWWPIPGIQADGVSGTAMTGPEAQLMSADRVTVLPSLWSLTEGRVRPGTLIVDGADIDLGDDITAILPAKDDLKGLDLSIGRVVLRNSTFRGLGVPNAPESTLADAYVYVSIADPTPGLNLSANGLLNDRPVRVSALLDRPLALTESSGSSSSLEIGLAQDWLKYNGRIGLSAAAPFVLLRGRVEASSQDAHALAAAIGVPEAAKWMPRRIQSEANLRILPAELRMRGSLRGVFGERELTLSGDALGEAGWVETGQAEVRLVARSGGLFSAHVDGNYNYAVGFVGAASISALDLQALIDWTGLAEPGQIVIGRNAGIKGVLSATSDAVAIREAEITVDQQKILGTVSLARDGGATILGGALSVGDLYVDPIAKSTRRRGQVVQVMELLEQYQMVLDLELATNRLHIGEAPLGRAELRLSRPIGGAPASLPVQIGQLDAYGGFVSGEAALGLGDVPDLTASLKLAEIDIESLVAPGEATVASGRLSGTAEMRIPNIMADAVADADVGDLDLSADVTAFAGALKLPLDSAPTIPFDQLTATVRAQTGVLWLKGLASTADRNLITEGDVFIQLSDGDLNGQIAVAPAALPEVEGGQQGPAGPATVIREFDLSGSLAAPVMAERPRELPTPAVEPSPVADEAPEDPVSETTTVDETINDEAPDAQPVEPAAVEPIEPSGITTSAAEEPEDEQPVATIPAAAEETVTAAIQPTEAEEPEVEAAEETAEGADEEITAEASAGAPQVSPVPRPAQR